MKYVILYIVLVIRLYCLYKNYKLYKKYNLYKNYKKYIDFWTAECYCRDNLIYKGGKI